jgi:carboxyl-terminal processing protease
MRGFWAWALCAPFVVILGGCAGGGAADGQMTEELAARTISSALEDIEDFYFREADASALVKAGLTTVEDNHPSLRFIHGGDTIVVNVSEAAVFDFRTAADHGAADVWGDRVAAALQHIATAEPGAGPDLTVLTDTFLRGVADSLDGYTHYAPRKRVSVNVRHFSARLGTLNIGVQHEDAGWRVRYIYSVPLRNARLLRKGDVILEIDGVSTLPLSQTEVLAHLLGEEGSPISLTVSRPGSPTPLALHLQREASDANSVATFPDDAAWHVQVTQFAGKSIDAMRDLLSDETKGPQPDATGIVLDLRDNPGGLLDSVVEFADLFLSDGRIADTHGRHRDSHQYFFARKTAPKTSLPLVVLIDEGSASGSEIVAAALQANGRAVVIGSASFGLGTIRTALPLPNVGDLIVTWAEVTTPDNYRLDKRGVMPTICTGGRVTAEEVVAALRSGGGMIDRAIRIRDIDPEDTAAVAAFRALCPPREDGADDVALEVAKAILADAALYDRILAAGPQRVSSGP